MVVHKEPTGGFWGEVPALPGCYSQGETLEELMTNLREAISAVRDVMQSDGPSVEPEVQVLELAV